MMVTVTGNSAEVVPSLSRPGQTVGQHAGGAASPRKSSWRCAAALIWTVRVTGGRNQLELQDGSGLIRVRVPAREGTVATSDRVVPASRSIRRAGRESVPTMAVNLKGRLWHWQSIHHTVYSPPGRVEQA